jgi:hypothetical protein
MAQKTWSLCLIDAQEFHLTRRRLVKFQAGEIYHFSFARATPGRETFRKLNTPGLTIAGQARKNK